MLDKEKQMLKEIIIKQFTSARFIMTILFSFSYCVVIIMCTHAMIIKVLAVETGVALIGAFAIIVREIANDYFQRKRPEENGAPK